MRSAKGSQEHVNKFGVLRSGLYMLNAKNCQSYLCIVVALEGLSSIFVQNRSGRGVERFVQFY